MKVLPPLPAAIAQLPTWQGTPRHPRPQGDATQGRSVQSRWCRGGRGSSSTWTGTGPPASSCRVRHITAQYQSHTTRGRCGRHRGICGAGHRLHPGRGAVRPSRRVGPCFDDMSSPAVHIERIDDPHVSLSRTNVLWLHQIDPFVRAASRAASSIDRHGSDIALRCTHHTGSRWVCAARQCT